MKIADIMVPVTPVRLNDITRAVVAQIPGNVELIPIIGEKQQYAGTISRRVLQILAAPKDQEIDLEPFVDPGTMCVSLEDPIDSVLLKPCKAVVLDASEQIVGSVDETQVIDYLNKCLQGVKNQIFAISSSDAVPAFQSRASMEAVFKELTLVKELTRELEATINSSYDGIFITDGSGMVLRINHAYERITGINANEVIGKNMQKLVEEKYYDESVTLLVMEKKGKHYNQSKC